MKYLKNLPSFLEKATWKLLDTIAKLIDTLFRMLFGRSPGLASKVPPLKTRAEDVMQAIKETAEPTLPDAYAVAHKPASMLHQYVSAKDATERAIMDLSGFTDEQLDWLLSLSDEHLQKLAVAGPEACERALAGKRCGIVGLPLPKSGLVARIHNVESRGERVYESKFARRIRAYRDECGVPYPLTI